MEFVRNKYILDSFVDARDFSRMNDSAFVVDCFYGCRVWTGSTFDHWKVPNKVGQHFGLTSLNAFTKSKPSFVHGFAMDQIMNKLLPKRKKERKFKIISKQKGFMCNQFTTLIETSTSMETTLQGNKKMEQAHATITKWWERRCRGFAYNYCKVYVLGFKSIIMFEI